MGRIIASGAARMRSLSMASSTPKTYQRLQRLLDSSSHEPWTAARSQVLDSASNPLFDASSLDPLEALRLGMFAAQAPQVVRCVRLLLANQNQAAKQIHDGLVLSSLPRGSWWQPEVEGAIVKPRVGGPTAGHYQLHDSSHRQMLLVALWCAPALAAEWSQVLRAKRFIEASAQMALQLR